MQHLNRNLVIFSIVLLAICQLAFTMPSIRIKRQDGTEQQITLLNIDDINPIDSQESKSQGLDREKRKLPEATFAGKNAVLGFVFGQNDEMKTAQSSFRSKRQTKKVEDDVPDLRKDGMVSLDVPDQLFSQSFTTVTNLSKVIGNFMMNSARRYSKFAYWFKPLFGNTLTVEGHDYVPTTTTKKPNSI